MMLYAADSALSKQQRRQFSATAARAECRISPQPRRKSCNGLSLYCFLGDATAYVVRLLHLTKAGTVPEPTTNSFNPCDATPPIDQRGTYAVLATHLLERDSRLRHLGQNHRLLIGRISSIAALFHLVCPIADAS